MNPWALLERVVCDLADIGHAPDLSDADARKKARRVYAEMRQLSIDFTQEEGK